jgi:hypothetical protein
MDDIRQQQPARGPLGGMDSAGHPQHKKQPSVDEEILLEKEETLQEMREVCTARYVFLGGRGSFMMCSFDMECSFLNLHRRTAHPFLPPFLLLSLRP